MINTPARIPRDTHDLTVWFYGRALDNVYALRVLCADMAVAIEASLALKTYPKSRRRVMQVVADRAAEAARGDIHTAYGSISYPHRGLADAGAASRLTRADFETTAEQPPSWRVGVDGDVNAEEHDEAVWYYARALDELNALRAVLAHTASAVAASLEMATYPKGRRAPMQQVVDRARSAVRTNPQAVIADGHKALLVAVGAPDNLTRPGFESQADARGDGPKSGRRGGAGR